MFNFDFSAFMMQLSVTEPFLFGLILGCLMVAPFVLFSLVKVYFRTLD